MKLRVGVKVRVGGKVRLGVKVRVGAGARFRVRSVGFERIQHALRGTQHGGTPPGLGLGLGLTSAAHSREVRVRANLRGAQQGG